jgi:hypothetical protein
MVMAKEAYLIQIEKKYEPPMLSYTQDEIVDMEDLLVAKSGMGMCKHTYIINL